jgi:D-alanyl-D-alanine dipeptidase
MRIGPQSSAVRCAFAFALTLALAPACRSASATHYPPPLAPNAQSTVVASDAAADSLLVDLSTIAPPPVVHMRYATSDNFTGAPLPGYEANRAFLRREAAAAFARASAALARKGYRIEVWDAYRPVRATDAMVAWTQRVHRTDLLRDGYIAERSRHNLGLAIDCTLLNVATGQELDMGTPFDTFSPAAHTYSATGAQLANRLILRDAMSAAGFVPYDDEWWHFAVPIENAPRFDRVIR